MAMPFSVKKTYLLFYMEAKMEQTKISRFEKIEERLNKNLNPM